MKGIKTIILVALSSLFAPIIILITWLFSYKEDPDAEEKRKEKYEKEWEEGYNNSIFKDKR